MKKYFHTLLIFYGIPILAVAQTYQAGKTYLSTNDYIEYRAGNLPIIITAPHGGRLEPTTIPDRVCDTCTTVMDGNTLELSYEIDTALRQAFGCFPHIIVNRLHRKKLDANREIREAALGNPAAEQAWRAFHQYVQTAKDSIVKRNGRGILIDIHGHGHTIQRLELGYMLSAASTRLSDSILNTPTNANQLSIKNLVKNNLTNTTPAQLLRGDFALGTLFENEGLPAVPSKQQPRVNSADSYFSGGYITARHGSSDSTTIDAIQIECHFTGVRDNTTNRKLFASKLAQILRGYLGRHYFRSLNFNCSTPIASVENLEIKVYPNPFVDYLTIDNMGLDNKTIFLIDMLGRVVKNIDIQGDMKKDIDLIYLPKGIYFLKMDNYSLKIFKM
jgi:N-formylglutamate amidohydrolase